MEAIEDLRLIRVRNADAAVFHFENEGVVVPSKRNWMGSSGGEYLCAFSIRLSN